MVQLRRRILLQAFKFFDLAVMILAAGMATISTMGQVRLSSIAELLSMRIKVGNFLIAAGLLIMWHSLFVRFSLYRSHRLSTRKSEIADVIKVSSLCTLILFAAATIFHIRLASPLFVFFFWAFSSSILICSRLVMRIALKQTRLRGRNLRHVLIVGSNIRTAEVAEKLGSRPELGYQVIGFVDREWSGCHELSQRGYSRVCDFEGLPEFLRKNVVDEVFITLPVRSFHDDAARVASMCEEQGIIVRFLPNLFNLKLARSHGEELDGDYWVTHYTGTADSWSLAIKRIIDFCVALAVLAITSPLLLVVAFLVKVTSPGPVLFTQLRVGQNKRKFTMYKLRTMVADAEKRITELQHLNEVEGPVFKIKNDPRITPLGKFLRKTSIDELPQLFNVLKGDMSLVGPRPLPLRDYEGFTADRHRRRFSVRPGITCLWQVEGRSSIPFEQWMELDMQYIDRWSLMLDLEILAKTIPAIWKGVGAA
jgi:exopolysaccharide biosynthesis polyprenyl glycosylphosphotransferase